MPESAGAKAGYVYLHSIVDGFSRLAYTEPLADEKGKTAAAFLARAKVWFAAHGMTHIHRVASAAIGVWNIHYNYHRPHSATGGRPPTPRLKTGVTTSGPPTGSPRHFQRRRSADCPVSSEGRGRQILM